MTTDTRAVGPERPGGQGLDPQQYESGNRAILKLLTTAEGEAWTDFVATYRWDADGGGAYEAWSRRGMVRWVRRYGAGGGYAYEVIEEVGTNPIANQDYRSLSTLDEELAAGRHPEDVDRAWVEPESVSYPLGYERIAQLFDSPNAPDLVVNAKTYAYGRERGQHGHLDVIQSRSLQVWSGPGVRRGVRVDVEARQVDIAPTILHLLGAPLIDGADASGRTSSERGVGPDVYLKRQDGRVLSEVLDGGEDRPEVAYILLLDGLANSELKFRLEQDPDGIPHLRRLVSNGALLEHGAVTNFPSITWPTHNAIGTGAWCGRHDIVNPTYYLRETRETVSPQGQTTETSRFLGPGVETIFEAVHRSEGRWDGERGAFSASVSEPTARGAVHAAWEFRLVGDRERLKALTAEMDAAIAARWDPSLPAEGLARMERVDNRALGQVRQLFEDESHPPPRVIFQSFYLTDSVGHECGPHSEALRLALDETDVRVGHVLAALAARGLLERTLFVITSDHGMSVQDVELLGNASRIPERDGMAAVTTEPFVYLRDLAVEIEVAGDGRTAKVFVCDNDADASGERPPVAGAEVRVVDERDGLVASARSDHVGVAGFGIPGDVSPAELELSVRAEGFNPRHLRLSGESLALDLREALYGAGAAASTTGA